MLLTSFEIRVASGAEHDWVDVLLRAARAPRFALSGAERASWEERLHEVRWLALKLHSEPSAARGRAQFAELRKASAHLLKALAPFSPGRATEHGPVPDEWLESRHGAGKLHRALVELHRIADEGENAVRPGGRPRVDRDTRLIVKLLLPLYGLAFARKPSPVRGGPTVRFVSEFFEGIKGEWCTGGSGEAEAGQLRCTRRFAVPSPKPETLRTAIDKAIKGRSDVRPLDAMLPLIVERFFRPPSEKGAEDTLGFSEAIGS